MMRLDCDMRFSMQIGRPLLLLTFLTAAEPPLDQVSSTKRMVASESSQITNPSAAQPFVTIDQAGVREGASPIFDQLAREPRQARAGNQIVQRDQGGGKQPPQVSAPGKTAQPSDPLTSRAEGKITRVFPVEGNDRCDNVAEDGKLEEICLNVIETRAAEFVRADPTALSPEQKLLTEQPKTAENRSLNLATRRLANDGLPLSAIEQGVAATVYDARRGQGEEQSSAPSEEAAAAISAVLGAIAGAPGQQ